MHPKVEDALRRVALKKLFARSALQPARSVRGLFERLDTIGDPIPDEMLKTLNQARTLLFSDEERQKPAKQEAADGGAGSRTPEAAKRRRERTHAA